MDAWGWLLIGLSLFVVANTAFDVVRKAPQSSLMHVFDSLLATFNNLATTFMGMFKDVIDPKTLLGVIAFAGFELVGYTVLSDLSADAPAAERFAILNLMLSPALIVAGYFFRVAEEAIRRNGRPPEKPPEPPTNGTP